jgi:hypothetical protein
MLVDAAAAVRRPVHGDLGEDPLTEQVSGPGERVRDVRMEALELRGVGGPGDAELERRARVLAGSAGGERAADPALLPGRLLEARGEPGIVCDRAAPALDAPLSLQPRDGGDQVTAGEVVRGRERRAGGVVRLLLGDRRAKERTAGDDAPDDTGFATQLARDG